MMIVLRLYGGNHCNGVSEMRKDDIAVSKLANVTKLSAVISVALNGDDVDYSTLQYKNKKTSHLMKNIVACSDESRNNVENIQQFLPGEMFLPENRYASLLKQNASVNATKATWINLFVPERDDNEASVDSYNIIGINPDNLYNYNVISCQQLKKFLTALPNCYPLILGFYPGLGDSNMCYCPYSKVMGGWRKTYNIPDREVNNEVSPCKKQKIYV